MEDGKNGENIHDDYVRFDEIQGMDALNAAAPQPVKVKGPFSFVIDTDVRALPAYTRGGYAHQVKQPKTFEFQSFADATASPKAVGGDISKWGRADLLHLGFRALDRARASLGGVLPEPLRELCRDVCQLLSRSVHRLHRARAQ